MSTANKIAKRYRAASWWITWEDLRYPGVGIEKQIQKKATKFNDAGIDGLMCDDIIHYPGWCSCAYKHCKAKFKEISGIELPAITDTSFWGNYKSAHLKFLKPHYIPPIAMI
jgi:hypothetical protein